MTDVLTEANNILDNEISSSTVTITEEEFKIFENCVKVLASLKAHGVDNWEGFEAAIKEALSE